MSDPAATTTATATAHGAVTIVNATATGRGCSLAVEGGVDAEWTWDGSDRFSWGTAGMDSRVATAAYGVLRDDLDAPVGASARTRSDAPPARGLKTSSAAAAALIQAGATALGRPLPADALCHLAVQASVAAGVTLTGAYDDQVAVVQGGCHVTDNAAGRILSKIRVEPWHVAVWVPDRSLPKEHFTAIDTAPIRKEIEAAEALLFRGDVPGAMTRNGQAFSRLYAGAGLPIKDKPARVAMKAGALGAGLSGTGPAVAALFDERVDLPPVKRGRWTWTRVVEAPA